MCGIAGIVRFRGPQVAADDIERLTDLLTHRGPGGRGLWFSHDRDVAFGHRRLAIIDPGASGDQPMISGDGRFVIVFNGEIYNFIELRQELEASGAVFTSQSDTEVILAAWEAWGEGMLLRFNGMWAFAIHDTRSGDTFFARDRFGIKPLLYMLSNDQMVFASEQRALTQSRLFAPSLDVDVARRLLVDAFGVEGSERTLSREVKRLQGGHSMWLKNGRLTVRRWWRTLDHLPDIPSSEPERAERFGELFRDSVALRMRSDVPIGTCLSGGFDSSAVLCAMAAHEKDGMGPRDAAAWRHAFVATFPGLSNDERPEAETAAAFAGVSPNFLEIGRNDALIDIDRILSDNDDIYISMPTAIWQIYRALRRADVPVSLDGHGADELMGGYRQEGQSFGFALRNMAERVSSSSRQVRRATDFGRALALQSRAEFFLRGGLRSLPPLFDLVGEDDEMPRQWDGMDRRLYRMFHATVLPTILRNFDRMSMAHGIEVRMPFMDWRLVTYTMALPGTSKSRDGYSKVIAREAMAGRMPESIRTAKRKVGFNSPMPEWMNGPLGIWMQALLNSKVPAFSDIVDEGKLRAIVEKLTARKAWDWHNSGRIWPYLNLKWALGRL